MKCDEFDSVVSDLARGRKISGEAAEHALGCRRCAARLESERELSARLGAMALADALEEAPLGVEARLVEELRSRGRRRRVPALTRFVAAFAAACALVAVSVLGARLAMQRKPHAEPPASQPIARPVNPNPACCPQRAQADAPEQAEIKAAKRAQAKIAPAKRTRGKRTEQARVLQPRRPVAPAANSKQAGGDANGEVATEFFAVPYGNTLDPITGGQILRIRLPRSAMSAVGLPVNQESTRGPVDADVLMDESMTVRAIRFVQ
jgi:hypothetical protein